MNYMEISAETQPLYFDSTNQALSQSRRIIRCGNTAIPNPLIAALTSAVVLIASHTGVMWMPACSTTRLNTSRVPLPFLAREIAVFENLLWI